MEGIHVNAKSPFSRRRFLAGAAACAAAMMPGRRARAAESASSLETPNIVLILADDLGYADLGVHGSTEAVTPHIDSIAQNGVRFTDGYVSCPVCSPTRAGLMTGRYQQRFGHEFNPGPSNAAPEEFGLPASETTLAEHLKGLGYATGLIGKWHLGYREGSRPLDHGFDEFYGFLGGSRSYFDNKHADPIMRGNEEGAEKTTYTTDDFGQEAVAFIDRHASERFFLYLAFNAVHGPLEAPDAYLDRFKQVADPKRRTYLAMLSAMDDAIGRVLETLEKNNLTRNTLVFFLSDNGGPTDVTAAHNTPLSSTKGMVYEGGIRVPFMAQWPATLPKGDVCRKPVISLDILPTAVAAAGGEAPAGIDGVNLLPYFGETRNEAPHEALYWRFGDKLAVRAGDWKLLHNEGLGLELYNLAEDAGEQKNLVSARPEKADELGALYMAWNAEMQPPRWPPHETRRNSSRRRRVR